MTSNGESFLSDPDPECTCLQDLAGVDCPVHAGQIRSAAVPAVDGLVPLTVRSGQCGCGCGFAHNPNSTFIMGHDQRLMSFLIRAYRDDAKVAYNGGDGVVKHLDPAATGALFLSGRGMDKLAGYLDRTPARKPRPAAAKDPVAAIDASTSSDPVEGTRVWIGAPINAKAGRWTYSARVAGMSQAGKVTAIEYTNKSGNVVVTDRFTLV